MDIITVTSSLSKTIIGTVSMMKKSPWSMSSKSKKPLEMETPMPTLYITEWLTNNLIFNKPKILLKIVVRIHPF